ncbi:MAG TPA: hypothetical protein VJ907_01450 [Halanaerobiales bacterium]|nr:hypothetical protein [Halanaerobiales bacterium]
MFSKTTKKEKPLCVYVFIAHLFNIKDMNYTEVADQIGVIAQHKSGEQESIISAN